MSGLELLQALDSAGYATMKMLVSMLWQSTILLTAVGVLLFFLRRRSPSVRFTLLVSAILCIPLLPFITRGMAIIGTPQKEIAVIPEYTIPVDITFSQQKHSEAPAVNATRDMEVFRDITVERPPAVVQRQALPAIEMKVDQARPASPVGLLLSYPWSLVLLVYCAGLCLFLCWIIIGRLRIRGWIENGRAVLDETIIDVFLEAAKRIGLKREFIVMESAHVPAPLTCRTLRPVVILPTGFPKDLTEQELLSVALHELSHVKRNDVAVLSSLALVKVLLFFHPLVWIAVRQISYLAELSCDSLVLEHTRESVSYADILTRIAENLPKRAITTELAAGFIFSKSFFARRIHTILSMHMGRIRSLSRLALAGTVFTALVSLAVALAFPLGKTGDAAVEKVTVTVTDSTGKPLNDATVYLYTPDNRSQYLDLGTDVKTVGNTNRNGALTFTIDPGIINRDWLRPRIIVRKSGHAVGLADITQDTNLRGIKIRIQKNESLYGTVVDSQGQSVAGAVIVLRTVRVTERHPGYFPGTIPGMRTTTDNGGRFVLEGLPEGASVKLEISASGYAKILYPEHITYRILTGSKDHVVTLEPEGRITGTVTNRQTGSPSQGIRVYAVSPDRTLPGSPVATTDSDGGYTITGLSKGVYTVGLVAEDTAILSLTAGVIENIPVEENETVPDIDLELVPGALVSGTITDIDTGKPIRDVQVHSAQSRFFYGSTLTDGKGRYQLRVPAGTSSLGVTPPSGYYIPSPRAIIVKADNGGMETDRDFQLKKGITIHGRVISPDAVPLADVMIEGRRFSGAWSGSTVTDENGEFTLVTTQDRNSIHADAEHGELHYFADVDWEIKADEELVIRLEKYNTARARGRLTDEEGNPLPGVNISYNRTIEFNNTDGDGIRSGFAVRNNIAAVTDDDGYFRASDLKVGDEKRYLSVNIEGYKYRTIAGMKDLKSGENDLGDFVLEKEEADRWIEGYVRDSDGDPVVGARLHMNTGYTTVKEVYTDARGYYRFDGLTRIVEFGFQLNHNSYGYYRFENVPTNETKNITLIKPRYHLSGRAVDTDGNPVEGARVSVSPQKHESGYIYLLKYTDSDGRFRFDTMIDERVNLSFYHHEKALSKKLEDIGTNRDGIEVVLEKFDRAQQEYPVWEFDKRRITLLEDGNAPELKMSQWLQGDRISLKNLRGKIVVLDFWTGENEQSVKGLEIMKSLYRAYGGNGLVIFGIHEYTEDTETLRKLLDEKNIPYPVAVDSQSDIEDSMGGTFEVYGLTRKNFPNMIIDRDGTIIRDVYDSDLPIQIAILFNDKEDTSPESAVVSEDGPTMSDDGVLYFDWDEGMAKARRENKPVFVKFDMLKSRFNQTTSALDSLYKVPEIRNRLANDWTCILLDLSGDERTVTFNGKTMSKHDLLRYFRTNTLGAHVFLDRKGEPVQLIHSHILEMNKDRIGYILDYMRDEVYEKGTTFQEYLKTAETERGDSGSGTQPDETVTRVSAEPVSPVPVRVEKAAVRSEIPNVTWYIEAILKDSLFEGASAPNKTAFDAVFENMEWKCYRLDNGDTEVELSGIIREPVGDSDVPHSDVIYRFYHDHYENIDLYYSEDTKYTRQPNRKTDAFIDKGTTWRFTWRFTGDGAHFERTKAGAVLGERTRRYVDPSPKSAVTTGDKHITAR